MRFVEPVEILEPGTGFVFHSISYGEHGYDSIDISSMRTADTAFEINSIPKVQFGGYASDTSHLPDRSCRGVFIADSGPRRARQCHIGLYFGAGPNPKGLIEVEPGELRELEILSRVYFTGTYYTTEDQSIEKMAHKDLGRSREILEALEPSRKHLSCMHQPERQGGRRQRL